MPIDQVTLTTSSRLALSALQTTAASVAARQRALATGRKVSEVTDGPSVYFPATSLQAKSAEYSAAKDSINQGISTLSVAQQGAETVNKMLDQMKGIANAALAATDTERAALAGQFNELRNQIDLVVKDTSYQGTNLLSSVSGTLTVNYGASSGSLTVAGRDTTISALGVSAAAVNGTGFTDSNQAAAQVSILAAIDQLDSARSQVASTVQTLGANVATLTARADFSQQLANLAQEGSLKISQADLNEEGAGLLALETRQQLATTALAVAERGNRSVLASP